MAKLRTTLPKEFNDFCYSRSHKRTDEDIEKCKEMLSNCDPNARERGFYKETALHHYVPFEIAECLIEKGADVNAANSYGTPLFKHAGVGNYDICRLLLEHGADVNIENYSGQTALFYAADKGHCDVVRLLLEYGADPCHNSRNFDDNMTPLLSMLRHMDSVPDKNRAITAQILANAQKEHGGFPVEELKEAQKMVALLGHNYNVCKDDINEDYRIEYDSDSAMEQLYELFDVATAAPVIKHDGKSPITVDENLSLYEQHNSLWEYLVPVSGKCATVQGEVIRITGRISGEGSGNGGANWDNEYRKMLKALLEFLKQGNGPDEDNIKAADRASYHINSFKACGCEEEINILIKCAVEWVKKNPDPIFLGEVNYKR